MFLYFVLHKASIFGHLVILNKPGLSISVLWFFGFFFTF